MNISFPFKLSQFTSSIWSREKPEMFHQERLAIFSLSHIHIQKKLNLTSLDSKPKILSSNTFWVTGLKEHCQEVHQKQMLWVHETHLYYIYYYDMELVSSNEECTLTRNYEMDFVLADEGHWLHLKLFKNYS